MFNKGDRVRVRTKYWGEEQLGLTGTIISMKGDAEHELFYTLPVRIQYDKIFQGITTNSYRIEDLELTELQYDPLQQGDKDEDI